jgi:hypothetical protein
MTTRTFVLATVILALAAPAATAAKGKQVAVEAIMTLQRLGSEDWQLDIQNSTPLPVTITQIGWTAPVGLKVERITRSQGGTCKLSTRGFQCKTQLAAPTCGGCGGEVLIVRFQGAGPGRTWVKTRGGGYWVDKALQPGHAVLTTSQARAQTGAAHGRPRPQSRRRA